MTARNPARAALSRAVNRAIAEGAPVYTEQRPAADIAIYELPPLVLVHAMTTKARDLMPETFKAPAYETAIASNDIAAAAAWFRSKGLAVQFGAPAA